METKKKGRPLGSTKVQTFKSVIGNNVTQCYCRKCRQIKKSVAFLDATDFSIDTNGKMSICSDCINVLYNNFYSIEKTVERTIYKLCKLLNVRYEEKAIEPVKKYIQDQADKNSSASNIFGIYKRYLVMFFPDKENIDMTYQDIYPDFIVNTIRTGSADNINIPNQEEYLIKLWGKQSSQEDYLFLEEEYSKWTGPMGIVTHGEEVLIREMCHKQNQIRKARLEGKSVDSLIDSFSKIMKDSALTPAMQAAANNGKNVDSWGVWIRDFETYMPAEWYDDHNKYHDIEDLESIGEKYITRPLKNFITGSRDFNVSSDKEEDDLEDINENSEG